MRCNIAGIVTQKQNNYCISAVAGSQMCVTQYKLKLESDHAIKSSNVFLAAAKLYCDVPLNQIQLFGASA